MSVKGDLRIGTSVMDDLQSTPISGRGADRRAVNQVEKWMAIIREISQERLRSNHFTSAEIDEKTDERTTLMVSMADRIVEANRTQREIIETKPDQARVNVTSKPKRQQTKPCSPP